jgi:hypothetical protein
MGLESLFTFGKYRGKQLEDVIHDDPSYIEWMVMENVTVFDEETLELISKTGIA